MLPRQRSDALLIALQDAGFEFVVVGGVAAIAHGSARSTKDLDVVAPMTPENIERLLQALEPHAPKHLTRPDLGVIRQEPAELAKHRLLLIVTDLGRLDVLSAVEPAGGYDELETVDIELVDGRSFRVLSLDQLLAIKERVGRPHDKAVVEELRALKALDDD